MEITPETGTQPGNASENNKNGSKEPAAISKPEFGENHTQKMPVIYYFLWIPVLILAIYLFYRHKKNKKEMERLLNEQDHDASRQ